jgi:hypothetical protein
MLLLQRVHLAADQLDLLDVTRDLGSMVSVSLDFKCNPMHVRMLTLVFIFDTALRLGLKLGSDIVQKLVQALAGAALRAPQDTGRVAVVHGCSLYAP